MATTTQATLWMVGRLFLIHTLIILASTTMIITPNKTAPIPTKQKRLIAHLIHGDNFILADKSSSIPNDISADLFPRRWKQHLFFVKFSIGQPPISLLAPMDTGSSILWVDCCYRTRNSKGYVEGLYYPQKSAPYTRMSCKKTHCQEVCSVEDLCIFRKDYASGESAQGYYALEEFTFGTTDGGQIEVPNVKFGCNVLTECTDNIFKGLFALGPDSWLVEQLGSKFSYCVGNVKDVHYSYNKLFLGDGAVLEGYSTPFRTRAKHYHVTLQGISIDGNMLDIDPRVFRETPGSEDSSGVIIDSGSTHTWLAHDGYVPLRKKVKELMDGILASYSDTGKLWIAGEMPLCYSGNVDNDLKGFPMVTFHFANGADLILDPASMFDQIQPDAFCMAVGLTKDLPSNLSLIGMMAQQNYNVGYDLNENKLYFQSIDCELLED